ncbi:unnamed protein product, partial [Rotaria sp. Silwood2]
MMVYSKKLVGIYTDYNTLFAVLNKQIHHVFRHLSMFKIFAYSNRSLRNLEKESPRYLWYKLLCDTLLQMDRNKANDKQEFLDFRPLRTEDVSALYKLRYFIDNLYDQLRTIFVEDYSWYEELFEPCIVYPRVTLSDKDIEILMDSTG